MINVHANVAYFHAILNYIFMLFSIITMKFFVSELLNTNCNINLFSSNVINDEFCLLVLNFIFVM